jgi:hypothetical protein
MAHASTCTRFQRFPFLNIGTMVLFPAHFMLPFPPATDCLGHRLLNCEKKKNPQVLSFISDASRLFAFLAVFAFFVPRVGLLLHPLLPPLMYPHPFPHRVVGRSPNLRKCIRSI